MADRVREALPQLIRGGLRYWGVWFGRPYDNLHAVVGCEAKNDLLSIYFNEEEDEAAAEAPAASGHLTEAMKWTEPAVETDSTARPARADESP